MRALELESEVNTISNVWADPREKFWEDRLIRRNPREELVMRRHGNATISFEDQERENPKRIDTRLFASVSIYNPECLDLGYGRG